MRDVAELLLNTCSDISYVNLVNKLGQTALHIGIYRFFEK